MSDLDQRLTAMLVDVAGSAPAADGLASAARRRQRARRKRRLAAGVGVVVLAVATTGITLGRGGGEDRVAHDPEQKSTGDGWSEVLDGEHAFSVPGDWRPVDCKDGLPLIYAAPDSDPCTDGQGARLGDDDEVDLGTESGAVVEDRLEGRSVWSGVVGVGQSYLSVSSTDRVEARRILASARQVSQPPVDVSVWVTFERLGMIYEVPAWWGQGPEGPWSAYSVCLVPPGTKAPEHEENVFVFSQAPGPQGTVVVTAPTLAVSELVMASVQLDESATPGECTPEDFGPAPDLDDTSGAHSPAQASAEYDRVTVGDVELEVPSGWTTKDDCNGVVEISLSDGCEASLNVGLVRFYDEALFDPVMGEAEVVGGEAGEPWVGYVRRGEYAVYIAHGDRQVVEDLLSRVK